MSLKSSIYRQCPRSKNFSLPRHSVYLTHWRCEMCVANDFNAPGTFVSHVPLSAGRQPDGFWRQQGWPCRQLAGRWSACCQHQACPHVLINMIVILIWFGLSCINLSVKPFLFTLIACKSLSPTRDGHCTAHKWGRSKVSIWRTSCNDGKRVLLMVHDLSKTRNWREF